MKEKMDEEQIEEEFLQDQIFLWEQNYAEEERLRMEIEADRLSQLRKPAKIIKPKTNHNVTANSDHVGTNNPTKRSLYTRKQGKKH